MKPTWLLFPRNVWWICGGQVIQTRIPMWLHDLWNVCKGRWHCNYIRKQNVTGCTQVLTAITFLEVLKTCASVIAWYPSRHTSSKMHVHDQSIPYGYEAIAFVVTGIYPNVGAQPWMPESTVSVCSISRRCYVLCCTTTGKWDLNRIVSKIRCADQSLGFWGNCERKIWEWCGYILLGICNWAIGFIPTIRLWTCILWVSHMYSVSSGMYKVFIVEWASFNPDISDHFFWNH
jgi:hypothetical protein